MDIFELSVVTHPTTPLTHAIEMRAANDFKDTHAPTLVRINYFRRLSKRFEKLSCAWILIRNQVRNFGFGRFSFLNFQSKFRLPWNCKLEIEISMKSPQVKKLPKAKFLNSSICFQIQLIVHCNLNFFRDVVLFLKNFWGQGQWCSRELVQKKSGQRTTWQRSFKTYGW